MGLETVQQTVQHEKRFSSRMMIERDLFVFKILATIDSTEVPQPKASSSANCFILMWDVM